MVVGEDWPVWEAGTLLQELSPHPQEQAPARPASAQRAQADTDVDCNIRACRMLAKDMCRHSWLAALKGRWQLRMVMPTEQYQESVQGNCWAE